MQCPARALGARALQPRRLAAFGRGPLPLLARASSTSSWRVRAQQQQQQQETKEATSEDEGCDHLAGEYCSLDGAGKRARSRTVGELEQDFLDALSSWYYDGKPKMSDEEFELLKEELLWAGSKVATLEADEQRFLEASMAYARGAPLMSDDDFDKLKTDLRQKNSIVSAQGPRCSLRSKKMYSDAAVDYVKMTLLNLPATLLVLGAVFSVDDITGFEITSLIELPPPWGIAALWGVLLPALFLLATSITNFVLRDGIILRAPCPNCGSNNFTYFGDIFTVAGNRGSNIVECAGCKADLNFDLNKRVVVVDRAPEDKAAEAAAAAAKKAAAAAKKAAAAAAKKDAA
jgi:hypothetical protein